MKSLRCKLINSQWRGISFSFVLLVSAIFIPASSTNVNLTSFNTQYQSLFFNPGSTVIIQNLETTQAQFSYSMYDGAGAVVYTSAVTSLTPNVPAQFDAIDIVGLGDGIYSTVISADRKIQSLNVSQFSEIEGDNLTLYPGSDTPNNTAFGAPIFKDVNNNYSTIYIQNASASSIDTTIQFYNLQGQAVAQFTFTGLATNATTSIRTNYLSDLPDGFTGWAEINATGNMVVLLEQASNQSIEIETLTTITPLYLNQPDTNFEDRLPRLFKSYDEGAGPRSSQIVLANPGEIEATLTITYTDSNGNFSTSPQIELASKAMQIVELENEDFLDDEEVYSALITSDMPVVVSNITLYDTGYQQPVGSYIQPEDANWFLPRIISQGNHFSVFSVQNRSMITGTAVVSFVTLDGSSIEPFVYTLSPKGFVRINTQDLHQLGDDFEGGALIASNASIITQVDEYNLVDNPVPTITSISPTSVQVRGAGFTMTVSGTGFIENSTITWNGSPRQTTFISENQLQTAISGTDLIQPGTISVNVENPPHGGGTSNTVNFYIRGNIYIPSVLREFPPYPDIPGLNPIVNTDHDNYYSVTWYNYGIGGSYVLEESSDPDFTNPGLVYQGTGMYWMVPVGGKLPGTYYYRVKTVNQYGESEWSGVQSVTIYPLFVGLQGSWDGNGFIRGSEYYDIGWHNTRHCDTLTEPDTIRCVNHDWYDPNPLDFDSETWNTYYSVSTGEWRGSDVISDPSWKWGASWKLAYDAEYINGSTVKIDGQDFTVTGPHWGYTTYGRAIQYWEFVNQDRFLYYDSGGDWTQYVYPGDAILRYDAGNSRLRIYWNVLRHDYYQGRSTGDTVHYIINLSSANSLPGSPLSALSEPLEIKPENSYSLDEIEQVLEIKTNRQVDW